MKETICTVIGMVGGFIAALIGGWDSALVTLVIFMGVDFVTGFVTAAIAENARVVMNQEDYNRRFDALSKQYDAAKQRHEQVQRQIQELAVRGQQLEQFQRQVFELGAVTEFDEALWGTLVDFITATAEGEKIVTFSQQQLFILYRILCNHTNFSKPLKKRPISVVIE